MARCSIPGSEDCQTWLLEGREELEGFADAREGPDVEVLELAEKLLGLGPAAEERRAGGLRDVPSRSELALFPLFRLPWYRSIRASCAADIRDAVGHVAARVSSTTEEIFFVREAAEDAFFERPWRVTSPGEDQPSR